MLRSLEAASRALGTLDGIARALPDGPVLAGPLLRREAIHSSRIDGIEASPVDLALFESAGTPATERDDVRAVANLVVKLHEKRLTGLRAEAEARSAPEAARTHQELFARDGREARLRLLADLGAVFDLSTWLFEHRDEYVARVQGAHEDWLAFLLEGIRLQAADAASRLLALDALRTDYRARVASARNAAALAPVLDSLFAVPATTGARLAELMGVTYPAARKTIDNLVEKGVLTPTTVGKRHYFVAEEVLAGAVRER